MAVPRRSGAADGTQPVGVEEDLAVFEEPVEVVMLGRHAAQALAAQLGDLVAAHAGTPSRGGRGGGAAVARGRRPAGEGADASGPVAGGGYLGGSIRIGINRWR